MYVNSDNEKTTLISQSSNKIYHQEGTKHNTSTSQKDSDSFENSLDEAQSKYVKKETRTDDEIIEDMKKLVEDIVSKLKTGMTKEEIEALEEALRKINEEMKKENYDKKEVEKMMQALERAVAYYKKKVTGEFISKNDNNSEGKEVNQTLELAISSYGDSTTKGEGNNKSKDTEAFAKDITERLAKASKDISELRNGAKKVIPEQIYNETEVLELIKKFQRE